MERKVKSEAAYCLDLPISELQSDFEHGQWWITHVPTGAQWSVCDSEPGPFCFEQVTRGEE